MKPLLGVALPLAGLKLHRQWIIEDNRDLELQDFFWANILNGDWKPIADEIKIALDGFKGRLGVHGPFWGFSIGTQDPDVAKVVNKRMHQGLDVCAHVGATQMVVHSPYTTWDYNNLDYNVGARDQLFERVQATIGDVVKRAESMGCVLVLENIEDKDPHARVELVKRFNSEALKVSIDTGHANYAHWATGGPPPDYYVHAAGNLLHHVHLQDTDGYADRHWNPGEGNIRWEEFFRALQPLTSQPRLILEVRKNENVRAGADFLASIGVAR